MPSVASVSPPNRESIRHGQPALAPIQPPDTLFLEDMDEADIYRGEPPSPPRSPSRGSTTSSSSSSFLGGGRLGAIAAVVELAITRWARGNPSSSSSSSSLSSSRSSIVTVSRSQLARRRKRRAHAGTLHKMQSERDISAHISRIKAREQSRQIPRQFNLYLPPPLSSGAGNTQAHSQRIISTSSLPLILGQLDIALKKSSKARRNHERIRSPPEESYPSQLSFSHHHYMLPESVMTPSRPASFTDLDVLRKGKKGKSKGIATTAMNNPPMSTEKPQSMPKAWWLDVSSPTWEDIRAIGKLLHLHPLTLEDILQQDPREKLELFPRLGYYFIVFRAIESRTTRERFQREDNTNECAGDNTRHDEGVVGEANVYLVVFNEGICSFHFTDISEHTDRVKNRVVQLEEIINMSSDWIAHGILDSIVDAFFPFLEEIEREVIDIDDIVFSDDRDGKTATVESPAKLLSDVLPDSHRDVSEVKRRSVETAHRSQPNEKVSPSSEANGPVGTRFYLHPPLIPLLFRRLGCFIRSSWKTLHYKVNRSPASSTITTLRRMARTRRLVTSLTRLLATKSEVVTQIRKRLLIASQSGLGNGTGKSEDIEVSIYMGDVQDHILTLQHSLAHYERMLSHSHPTYLSQLRTTVASIKVGTDKAVIILTVVSMAVLCIQTLVGCFSLNVTMPSNGKTPGGRYNVFGIVIALAILILCSYLSVVWWWWIQAKRRRGAIL